MNLRERFLKVMHFEEVDRVPIWDFGFWPETLERWYNEGLPYDVHPGDFFGMDRNFEDSMVALNSGYIPPFEEKVISDDGTVQILIDTTGVKLKRFKDKTGFRSIPQYFEFPVKNKSDFLEITKRLNPLSSARYPKYWDDYKKSVQTRNYPLGIHCGGFFGWVRKLMGIENLSIAFYEDKSLIIDMFDFSMEFTLNLIEKAVKELDIDFALFWEDMAYNKGSLLSPKLFKELMSPRYKKITDFLYKYNINIVFVDCDGNIDELVPLWLEVGINGMYPLEVQSGSTPRKYREKYGKNILLMGGIDKIALLKDKSTIEKEVMDKKDLIYYGGYIPFVDHKVSPDISLENYIYYLNLLKKVCKDVNYRRTDKCNS